ncbi:Fe(3+) dicitrate ABC transporter ATP-binding protein FecE [Reinekea sp. G2M2-21]|uniref:Fe(3+) dicitrate ABC transporter ATP-binding protein FecE n=1 Tax=Reinekea sp. G2M2-21 TaxID=2788942 RepID=UPI0018A9014E|nr:Fe(3+) dicitrate ABC transporter ATP-binding protein FecE [Reinekea sp. G2M2-21]
MHVNVTDLSVSYRTTLILDKLNLSLPEGKLIALVGPNGCGKSTLLKSIARLLAPRDGQIFLEGQSIHSMSAKDVARKLALLTQTPITPDGISVRDLVAYGRAPYLNAFGHLSAEDKKLIQRSMMLMGVEDLAENSLIQLSGGQRQRVWIAMALAQQTNTLLLDEPTTYLDMAHQVELMNHLQLLNKNGKSIIVVLHDLNQACRYADMLVVLKQGRVVATGTPEQVMSEALLQDVFELNAKIFSDPIAGTPMCIATH